MHILLIDDSDLKINQLKRFLIEQGIEENDLLIAKDAADASRKLNNYKIDLMLIDVLLPARKDAKPRADSSINLLRLIVEDGILPTPAHILGVTACEDTRNAVDDQFRELVTNVLHVSADQDDWKGVLKQYVQRLLRVENENTSFIYDVVVLNALRKPELEAIYSSWPLELTDEKLVGTNINCKTGYLKLSNDKTLKIACAHLSQMGPVAATHSTEVILRQFRPRVIIMTGICGGFSDAVSVGDVVIAEKSWDWQSGKWVEDWSLQAAADPKEASPELVSLAKTIDSDMQSFYQQYTGYRPPNHPKLISAPMVSGSSVVASADIQKIFRTQHRKMAAIDMECYGLYYSCANHHGQATKMICIKSVSDLADRAKDDNFQSYCSFISACVGLKLIDKYFK